MKLFKNLSLVTLSELIEKAVIFLLFIYMGRILSPIDFGYINYILALLSYFVIFIDLGLPQLSTREVASHIRLDKKILKIVISVKIFLFIIVAIIWATYVLCCQREYLDIAMFMEFYLFSRVVDMFWYFQAKQQFVIIAKIKLAKSVILAISFILLLLVPSYKTYLIVLTVSLLLPFIYWIIKLDIVSIFSIKAVLKIWKTKRETIQIFIVKSLPLIVSTFLILMYYNLDTILIKYFMDYESVARYNAAYKIVFAFIVVRSVFTSVIFPRMAEKKVNWREGKLFATIGVGVAVLITLFMYYFSGTILSIAYGEKYIDSEHVLFILSLTASVLWINLFYPTFFIAVKREKFYMKVHIITALINLVGNILLIPLYGIEGAAFSTLLADITSLMIFGSAYYKIRFRRK